MPGVSFKCQGKGDCKMINKSSSMSEEEKEQRIRRNLQGYPGHLSAVLQDFTTWTLETLLQQVKVYCVSIGIVMLRILGALRSPKHSLSSPMSLAKSSPDSSIDLFPLTVGEAALQSLCK